MNYKICILQLKAWIKAIRLPFLTATVIPIVLGSIAAWRQIDNFIWGRFWLTVVGGALIHIGTNLANDYFDHLSGCDKMNSVPTPFSGGSRVIQEGLISPRKILSAALASFCLGIIIGLYLNYFSKGNVILILGIVGVFLGFFYTAKPFQIGYGSFGELAAGVGFGPLLVLGAYYVQAQTLSLEALLLSIPVGILIALVLFINEFPDCISDRAVGKKTLVVILGKRKSAILYYILLILAYLSILYLILTKILPLVCFIAFFSLPLAIGALKVLKNNFNKIAELLPANALTIKLHSVVGLLLSLGLFLDKIVGNFR